MTTLQSDNTTIRIYYQLGIGYLDSGLYQNALDCFLYVKEKVEQKKQKTTTLAKCYSLLGRTFLALDRLQEGKKYQKKALRIFRSLHRKSACPSTLASCLSSLALCFEKETKEKKGLRFRKKALRLLQKEKPVDQGKIALCNEAIGMNHYRRGNDKKAFDYFVSCLKYWKEQDTKPEISERLNRILGEMSYAKNNIKDAFSYLSEVCRLQEIIYKEFPYHRCFEETYFTLGCLCDKMEEYEMGLTYFLKAFRVAEVNYKDKKGDPYLCLLYQSLYYDFIAVGDSLKAVYFYRMWEESQAILLESLQQNNAPDPSLPS